MWSSTFSLKHWDVGQLDLKMSKALKISVRDEAWGAVLVPPATADSFVLLLGRRNWIDSWFQCAWWSYHQRDAWGEKRTRQQAAEEAREWASSRQGGIIPNGHKQQQSWLQRDKWGYRLSVWLIYLKMEGTCNYRKETEVKSTLSCFAI